MMNAAMKAFVLARGLKKRVDASLNTDLVSAWYRDGRQNPPPHAIKVRNVCALASLFQSDILVETGTFRGDMLAATKHVFKELYSIEVYDPLVQAARWRFRNYKQVNIIAGNSGDELAKLLPRLNGRILFFLDGHYSGSGTGSAGIVTPIEAEIETIISLRGRKRDVIVIDDARLFDGTDGYPDYKYFRAKLTELYGVAPVLADDSIILMPTVPGS